MGRVTMAWLSRMACVVWWPTLGCAIIVAHDGPCNYGWPQWAERLWLPTMGRAIMVAHVEPCNYGYCKAKIVLEGWYAWANGFPRLAIQLWLPMMGWVTVLSLVMDCMAMLAHKGLCNYGCP